MIGIIERLGETRLKRLSRLYTKYTAAVGFVGYTHRGFSRWLVRRQPQMAEAIVEALLERMDAAAKSGNWGCEEEETQSPPNPN